MKHKEYIHTPKGSPRNSTRQGSNKYSCGSPLPKFTATTNVADSNNGKTADKPAAEKGGLLFHPTR